MIIDYFQILNSFEQPFDIFIRLLFGLLEIESFQDVLHLAAGETLDDPGRPVIVPGLAPWIDLLKDLQLLFFVSANPLFDLGY